MTVETGAFQPEQGGFTIPSWYRGPNFAEILKHRPSVEREPEAEIAIALQDLSAAYKGVRVFEGVSLEVLAHQITAIIGPSGCGKSTLLRTLNLMSRLDATEKVEGTILFNGRNINTPQTDPVEIRSRIGMVFQTPNPFSKSIYDNVAYGPRLYGVRGSDLDAIVEEALVKAGLWPEVKNNLRKSALALSGGQQQRLCIARTIAVEPEIILMDEPCSALDPISSFKIEELMRELAKTFTVITTTHNMQQAARVADEVVVLYGKPGKVIEQGSASQVFLTPKDQRTERFITGKIE